MTIRANSYGTTGEVAALAKKHASTGDFLTTTTPTLAQVVKFIDRVSAVLNGYLAGAGFTVPIIQADAKLVCDEIVVELVVDLVLAANSAGRFFTNRQLRAESPLRIVRKELADWVEDNAAGLQKLGAARATTFGAGILARTTDESGDDVSPFFQREDFGEAYRDIDT